MVEINVVDRVESRRTINTIIHDSTRLTDDEVEILDCTMVDTTGRTYWSKDPDEAPPYSDWEITFAKNGEDHTERQDGQTVDDIEKGSDGTNNNKRRKHNDGQADGDTRNRKRETAISTTYRVHRNMIGPRSEYFNRIFDENRHGIAAFTESRNHRSVIEFSTVLTQDSFDHIRKAFEAFLDYCYSINTTSMSDDRFTRGNRFPDRFPESYISPVALVFLIDYFQITHPEYVAHIKLYTEELKKESSIRDSACVYRPIEDRFCAICAHVINFRSEGLSVETMEAILFKFCINNYKYLTCGSKLSKVSDVKLWLSIGPDIRKNCSLVEWGKWSDNIAYFIDANLEVIDDDEFQQLTNVLPIIHPKGAVIFLREERRRGLHERSKNGNKDKKKSTAYTAYKYKYVNGNKKDTNDDDETVVLTDLQDRCVVSFDKAELENTTDLREQALSVMSNSVMKEYVRRSLSRLNKVSTRLENRDAICRKLHNEGEVKYDSDNYYYCEEDSEEDSEELSE